jgi:hypothetical protein
MSGRHGGGGGGGGGMLGVGIGIGIGAAIGAGSASQPQQPSAPPRGTPPKQRVAKPGPKPEPEPERKREVCSAENLPELQWEDVPSPVPLTASARRPGEKEWKDKKWIIFEEDGTIRCVVGAWNLWVYTQKKGIKWGYDRKPRAPAGKNPDPKTYSIDSVAREIKPKDAPELGWTPQEAEKAVRWTKAKGELLAFRASQPASLAHLNKNVITKPLEYYVTADGDRTEDASRRAPGSPPLSTANLHVSETTGKLVDNSGDVFKIDDKEVIADRDLAFVVKKGADGIYDTVITDPKDDPPGVPTWISSFNEWMNQGVDRDLQIAYVRHAADFTYKKPDL